MKTSIQNFKPTGINPPSHGVSQKNEKASAPRKLSIPFRIALMLTGFVFLLCGAPSAHAHSSPPGCTGSGLGILLFTDAADVHIGDTLNYSVTVFNGTGTGPIVCDAESIQAAIVTPDNVSHGITLRRTTLMNGQSDYYSNVVSYVVRAQDIRSDGTVRATASDTGVIHQNDTDSQGGGEQGVNTEVSLPCIALLVQCVPGVGENGAITFTGTVTNCGNNTLVGVTITNFVNGGQFPVTFITNLLRGQIATFSGSWIPANPCIPSTATLVAQGTDRFTTRPRTVTSSIDTTCSVALTPGIKVTKECPVQPVSPGQLLTFSGSVSNTGNVTLTNIVVVNNQPSANTPVFTIASLAPGAMTTFTGSYLAPTNCSVSDTLTATANSRCGVPVSDSASATCPILTTPGISVTEICPTIPGVSGGSSSYSGVVQNTGNITLNNVVVVSDRPSANTVVFTAASLAPGASANYSGTFTVPLDVCTVTTAVRATGTDACSGAGVTNTASATCPITTAPAIAVTLTCPVVAATNGGPISYTGTVRNSGNVTLINVVVTNSQSSPSTVFTAPSLAPGASANFTASFTAPIDTCSVSSTVNASGTDQCSLVVVSNSASATCTLGTSPRIVVTQNCSANPVSPGGMLNYSGSVSNAGNITLTNIVITNDRTGTTPVFTTAILLPGATANFTGTYTVPAGSDCSVTSTVTARANDNCSGSLVSSTASATCSITGMPLIAVTLNCPATPVATGNSITFSGTVSNPGNVALVNVTVVNNQASPSTVLTVPSLAPGASVNFTATFTSPANACSVTSSVTARGTNTCAGEVATDTASATCNLLTAPALIVRQDCPVTPVSAGGVLNYSGSVSNAGNITLTNVVVVNSQTGTNVIYTALALLPGAVSNFNGSYTVPADALCTVSSAATATAHEICTGTTLTNITTVICPLATAPAVAVTLNCPSGTTAPGGLIVYTGTVRNSGNVTLNDVTVVNNQASPSTVLTLASLAPGASANFTASFTAPLNACAVSSTVLARGTDACSSVAVTNTASATCPIGTAPSIVITENCPTTAVGPGGTLIFTGTVRNSGNITLTNVIVRSDRTGSTALLTLGSLAAGAVTNYSGSYSVPSDNACSITTVVTASGNDVCSGISVTNTASITCPIIGTPRLIVTQSCPLVQVAPGGMLTFSGTVSNAGNVTVTNVVVTSDRVGATPVFSVASLAPGETANFSGTYLTHTDCCVDSSTVTATGRDCNNTLASDTATRTCSLLTLPGIVVTKFCPTKKDEPGVPQWNLPGERLEYSGSVSNSGDITLVNVTIVANAPTNGTPIFGPITLAAGESVPYIASFIVPNDFCGTFTVEARGLDLCTQLAVTNSATSTCPVMTTPRIAVTKNCPAQPTVHGGMFIYTGTVSNAGNVTLTNVFVVNNQPNDNTPVIGPITLAPGARTNFTGSYPAPTDCCEIIDTLTARGNDRCGGTLVAATATQVCPLLTAPRISVVARCPSGTVPVGGLYNFTGSVTNTGDVVLTNVYVLSSHPVANTVILGPIELASGESEEFAGSFTVVAGSGGLIVTATGLDTCKGRVVTASANCSGPIGTVPPPGNTNRPAPGTYNGLFFMASDVQQGSSGYFTFNLTSKDTYTASVWSEGKKYSAKGKLSPGGHATNSIPRSGKSDLTVVWWVSTDGSDGITGTVTDGQWISGLMGDRAVFVAGTRPAPQAGRYTLIIPGTPGATDSPEGDGYGTVVVSTGGKVSLVGRLADGTKVTQTTSLSKNGDWPLYASLYSGRGSLLGWLLFADRTGDDISGKASWIRPAISTSAFYPAGFEVDSDALGSSYVKPAGTTARILEITHGVFTLSGGNRSSDSANEVMLGLGSKVTNLGTNKLTLSFTLSSGLFKGTFTEVGTTRKITFNGAVLQKMNDGSGYFLDTTESGRVLFEAAP